MRIINIRIAVLVFASLIVAFVLSCSNESGFTEPSPNNPEDVYYGGVIGFAHYGGVKTNGIWCSFQTWTEPPGQAPFWYENFGQYTPFDVTSTGSYLLEPSSSREGAKVRIKGYYGGHESNGIIINSWEDGRLYEFNIWVPDDD